MLVSPVYEGWYEVDGRKYALFGYSNRNLEEIVDIPIGPNNHVAPGPPDQGQPTRFFPGMHYGVFAAALPNDQPKTEVTWTLTANGQTLSIPVSLDAQYFISPQQENGGAYPGNTPPVLKFDPAGASAQGPHGIVVTPHGHGGASPHARCLGHRRRSAVRRSCGVTGESARAGADLAGVPRRRRASASATRGPPSNRARRARR